MTTACRTCVTPINFIDCPTGGWWAHEKHPADGHDAVPGAWADDDPLMEAIAAAVWEHCAIEDTMSLIVDDPRNIAGTAAAVARHMLDAAVAAPPPATRADKAEALLLRFTAEAHRRKWAYDRGLDDDGVPLKSEAFDALHRLGEEMRVALEGLCRMADEAQQPDTDAHVSQSEPQPPSPRCALCTHPKRDHSGRSDHRAKFSSLVAGDPWCHACNAQCDYDETSQPEFQDRGDEARRAAGIDGTAGDAQDVPHAFVLDEPTGGCLLCGLASTYRKHTAGAQQQPETVRCPLCPDARPLDTPAEARDHFAAVHSEQQMVGPGPWPLLVTDGDEAQQQPDTETRPQRGDAFEAWLKAQRDAAADYPEAHQAADGLLDLYRLHADTGTPLGEHVCEGQAVGDCEYLEQPEGGPRRAGSEERQP